MKKFIFTLAVVSFLFSSCGSDCELTDINEIIVGDWTLNGFDLTFNSNGVIDDPTNVLEASINDIELSDKTWSIEGDSVLLVRYSSDDPPASLTSEQKIISYECDEIVTNQLINFTYKRK